VHFILTVRLVGSDGTAGDVEILYIRYYYYYYYWRAMCDDGWNLKAATVVCRQLNLGPPRSIYSHSARRSSVSYGIESVVCNGNEHNIGECNYIIYDDCSRNESAGVICSPST